MKTYIPPIPGDINNGAGDLSDILTVLGITTLSPVAVPAGGPAASDPPMAVIRIGSYYYSLKEFLAALAVKMSTGVKYYATDLPIAAASNLGWIYVYTGATDTYTQGHIYKCTLSGEVYSWTDITALTAAEISVADTGENFAGATVEAVLAEIMTLRASQPQFIEKTGYGVLSGMLVEQQDTPDMTVKISSGIYYKSDGTRQVVASVTSMAVDAPDSVKDRIDLIYKDADGVYQYLAGTISVDAVAGARGYTVAVNAVEDDTITIDGVVITAIRITPSTDEFNIGATLALTATALYTVLGLNANIAALYDVTNPSDGVFVLTEKVAGGGNTPGEAALTGDIDITNGSPTVSAAAVAGVRDYVITDRAEENDTFTVDSETMTCINGTPITDEFEEAGTIAQTAINLAAALAANANIAAKYDVTIPTAGTIRLTEKTPGGGDTPSTATIVGTLAVTDSTTTTSAAAVAGARSYTVVGNAGHKDTVTIDGETMTALLAAAGDNQFVPGGTAALTATELYNLVNSNPTLSAKYTATNPSAGVFLLTETTPGGGDTPGEAAVSGTVEITNGEATESVAAVSAGTVPATPAGCAAIAELDIDHTDTTVTTSSITMKRVWNAPGVND